MFSQLTSCLALTAWLSDYSIAAVIRSSGLEGWEAWRRTTESLLTTINHENVDAVWLSTAQNAFNTSVMITAAWQASENDRLPYEPPRSCRSGGSTSCRPKVEAQTTGELCSLRNCSLNESLLLHRPIIFSACSYFLWCYVVFQSSSADSIILFISIFSSSFVCLSLLILRLVITHIVFLCYYFLSSAFLF